MSSVSSSPAQVDRRTGYFYVITQLSTAGTFARNANSGAVIEGIMTSSDFTGRSAVLGSTVAVGTILRDMGKQVTIVDATTGLHTQVWRRVQVIDDDANGYEGVQNAAYQDLYVLTWSASAAVGVPVVRTG